MEKEIAKQTKKPVSDNISVYQQLQRMKHINIMGILSCEEKDGHFLIEEEAFEGRTMESILQSQKVAGDVFYDWMLQICDALEYLHSAKPPITGAGLRSADIPVGQDNVIKLADFSEATNIVREDGGDAEDAENPRAQDIAAVIRLMQSVRGRFMRKYASLLRAWENGEGPANIGELRRGVIAAYSARFGVGRVALIGVVSIFLLIVRVVRRLF